MRLLERPLQRVAGEEEAGLIPSVDARETRPPADERLGHLTQLTQREWTILQLLLENQRVGSIAQALSIGPSTVRTHLTSIFHKLGVHSQTELLKQIGSGAVKRITVKTPAGS